MACETKTWLVMVLLFLAANYLQDCVHGVSQVPCLFIFGDSLSDSGNNNELPTSAKSNYRPYGIDFPLGPTGRFTNGRTEIDIITQLLGFEKFIPPFANTSGSDILKGVNYASGGAGIRVETSSHLGATISFGLQLANHRVIVSQIASRLGSSDLALQYLEKCLYYVNIGSNDYMNNYFLPQLYPASRIYSLEQYAQALIEELSLNLLALHDLGARKYVLARLGRIGCTPSVMHSHGTNGSCVEEQNAATSDYNNKLKALVDQFNDRFSANSKFILIPNESNAIDIAHVHVSQGFWFRMLLAAHQGVILIKSRAIIGVTICFGMKFIPPRHGT
ncbi:GDSL esterase/lipase At1g29670-like isoform X3 [Glycine soja]|uniref:GDSL esterase/lipase At1g29670 isoform X2 n=1 Tax=Glycine max TaxID=3847 RepID=UPI0003DE80E2|nr:GDSL esterase/lipase At1g29670 isoform X2 [Glycine max]XP_028190694.1 GDSL esterase/lipase At1g29670-like isoform X3 [Glycine soja]|eukprot:XP_006594525.1 GDSL esterase/lipase At1g29670 isoform X2 [Glycine max]